MKRVEKWQALPLLTALLGMFLAGFHSSVDGQVVQGQLVDRETRAPVEGALVVLVERDGPGHDRHLTDTDGRFLLRAQRPGTYSVRAERIGFGTVYSEHFTLSEGQLYRLTLETVQEAIQLEGITVQGEQQCVVRPGEGLERARVWGEARKALTGEDWTRREGMYRFQVVNYSREMDPDARRVLEENRTVSTGISRSPIGSLPAEDLMNGGFVRENADGTLQYYGPDASTLLSDIFLDTHCFTLRLNRDEPNLIGLAFEPVAHGDFPDIQGTLWLDRTSSALQFLEYGYTWAPHPEARGRARGRVEFEELPNGSWIVRRWWIRMPQLAQGSAQPRPWERSGVRLERPGIQVAGIRESGGEIVQVSSLDRRSIPRGERGLVSGLVWDSTRVAPLEGARVYLSGTAFTGTTNAEGRFLIDGVPEGAFTASFTHPRLDTLAILVRGMDVQVVPGDVFEVQLGVPSMASIVAEACRGEARQEGSAVITGSVLDPGTGDPIPHANVSSTWRVDSRAPGGLRGEDQILEATTNGRGRFTICGLPAEELLDIQAAVGERRSDVLQLRVDHDSYTVVDIGVLPSSEASPPEGGSGRSASEMGAQVVGGRLLDSVAGSPVGLAQVTLVNGEDQPIVLTITDTEGRFHLVAPEPGLYWLKVQSEFYENRSHGPISLTGNEGVTLTLELQPLPVEMRGLIVDVERRSPRLALEGVYDRMADGVGAYFDRERIEARPGRPVSELIALLPMVELWPDTLVPGLRVAFRQRQLPSLRSPDGMAPHCFPQVFVDGVLFAIGGEFPAGLDHFSADDIEAIEVYESPAFLPARFHGVHAQCGTIVLWTR